MPVTKKAKSFLNTKLGKELAQKHKRRYRKERTSFANKVIRAVRSKGETKRYTQGFVDTNIDQRLDTTNQQRFLFQPVQGTKADERIGNKVFLKGIRVRAVFTIMQNMDYPHIVKLMLYKLRGNNNVPSQAQLDRMVDLGDTATHLGETLMNLIRPINKDLFVVYKTKMVKMAKAQHGTGTSNNDYKFTYIFDEWISIRKTIKFDDADTNVATNFGMYFGGAAVRADGDIASPQFAVINYDMDMTYYYTDI